MEKEKPADDKKKSDVRTTGGFGRSVRTKKPRPFAERVAKGARDTRINQVPERDRY